MTYMHACVFLLPYFAQLYDHTVVKKAVHVEYKRVQLRSGIYYLFALLL